MREHMTLPSMLRVLTMPFVEMAYSLVLVRFVIMIKRRPSAVDLMKVSLLNFSI